MRPGGPSIGVFNASFALIVRTVRTSVRYRKPCSAHIDISGTSTKLNYPSPLAYI